MNFEKEMDGYSRLSRIVSVLLKLGFAAGIIGSYLNSIGLFVLGVTLYGIGLCLGIWMTVRAPDPIHCGLWKVNRWVINRLGLDPFDIEKHGSRWCYWLGHVTGNRGHCDVCARPRVRLQSYTNTPELLLRLRRRLKSARP